MALKNSIKAYAWKHDLALSSMGDRVFCETPRAQQHPLKVLCICPRTQPGCNGVETVIRDHNMMIRPLPSITENGLTDITFHSLCETLLDAKIKELTGGSGELSNEAVEMSCTGCKYDCCET